MARPDMYPSQGPVSLYSSPSCKTPAPETIPQPYAGPTDPHRPATTKPIYDSPPAASDGVYYPIYPESYEASGMNYNVAGAMAGQPAPGASTTNEADMAHPPGWDYSMFDFQTAYSPLSPGTVRGTRDALQPQTSLNYGARTYPSPTDITMGDMLSMGDPTSQCASAEQPAIPDSVSHYVPARESTNGSYDSIRWPHPPPMGQVSPSPSQSSYYISSPASGAGAHYSRHNSCSSLPAARVVALEQTRFDARFHPVPDQAVSPGDGQEGITPGGLQTSAESYAGQTIRLLGDPQSQSITTNTTTDHHAGTVSPAMTPSPKASPKDTVMAMSSQAATKNVHNPSNQRASKPNKRKKAPLPPRRETTKQKQAEAGSRSQGQQQHPQHPQQQHNQAGGQAKGQAEAAPQAKPTARHRNRDAANKCRAKSKKAEADLESTERAMGTEHRELSAVARGLRDEVLMLKNVLLAHGSCGDDLIQQYLTNQARRVGYGTAARAEQQQQEQQQQHRQPEQHQ